MSLLLTTILRLLVAPLVILVRLLGVLLTLLIGIVKLILMVALAGLVIILALQVAGVGVDLAPAEDIEVPGVDEDVTLPGIDSGDGIAPGDPDESTYEYEDETVNSTTVERAVHEAVNEERADHGTDALEWDSTVASVARAHSKDMADREYFSHTNPDGDEPFDRYRSVGGDCHAYGENIAMTWVGQPVETENGEVVNYGTDEELAEGLVQQWMESPGHRENLLEDDWASDGVGVYVTDDGQIYATHNFCRGFSL